MTCPLPMSTGVLRTALLLLLACGFFGCGPYTMKGRVVRMGYPAVLVVPADDPRLKEGQPIPGASVAIIQDPNTLARREQGSTTSGQDGEFSLRVNAMGAGITDEEWLISSGRRGFGRTESTIRLPFSANDSRLLIYLAPGVDDGGSQGTTSDAIEQEVNRFWNQ